MNALFVTATGTDIGKTFVTAGLVRHLRAQGRNIAALKPVVSGLDPDDLRGSDPGRLLAALGRAVTPDAVAAISPWRFRAPLSPDMAAAREGRAIDFDALLGFTRGALGDVEIAFVEGVGGVMSPIDATHTVLDWMAALRLPLLIVSGSYLGTISHTLSALDVVARRGLAVRAVVVSESPGDAPPLEETRAAIARFAAAPVLALERGADDAAFAALWNGIAG